MSSHNPHKNPIAHLRFAFNTLFNNPVIFFPFCVVAFIQILALEILFFAPRYPLSIFFGPIISKMRGDIFLHYPYNFLLLTEWFQKIQLPIYVFFTSFFIGSAVAIIQHINNDEGVRVKDVFRRTFSAYVHLLVIALISVSVLFGLSHVYRLLMNRAVLIRSTSGIYFILKQVILVGAPYFNLLQAVFVTTLFAFVIPIIIIEKKKVGEAIILNFKNLWGSFWFLLTIIALPLLLYLPILLMRTASRHLNQEILPEAWGVFLLIGTLILLFIDATQYTAITTLYLYKKESAS